MILHALMNYNFVHFPLELMICETIFLLKKPRKDHFPFRLLASLILYFILSCGLQALVESFQTEALIPLVFLYLGYALLTAIPIAICFEIQRLELLFAIAGGYATQHMCFAFLRIYLYLSRQTLDVAGMDRLLTQYVAYILWAFIVYLLIIRKNQDKENFAEGDIRIAVLAIVLALAAIVLSVFYSNPADAPLNKYNCILCPAYGILCCALVLVMEYYVLRENRMKKEREMMEELLHLANVQQESSKEAINIINMKCHDLKHQLRAFTNMNESAEREEYVKEVQQAVAIYDAIFHTGSEPLDYVLREKSLLINEYQVAFSCMADGALLNFMKAADIYALMGNALDNALERVIQEEEEERSISLHINRHQDMILLHLENRCSRTPEFEDALPLTEKADKNQHGFGVRSIRYIAEKYNGILSMKVRDGKFLLDILFPVQ